MRCTKKLGLCLLILSTFIFLQAVATLFLELRINDDTEVFYNVYIEKSLSLIDYKSIALEFSDTPCLNSKVSDVCYLSGQQ